MQELMINISTKCKDGKKREWNKIDKNIK